MHYCIAIITLFIYNIINKCFWSYINIATGGDPELCKKLMDKINSPNMCCLLTLQAFWM